MSAWNMNVGEPLWNVHCSFFKRTNRYLDNCGMQTAVRCLPSAVRGDFWAFALLPRELSDELHNLFASF